MAFKRIVTALSILLLTVACQIVGPAPEVPSAAALKGDALEVRKATREMDLIDQGRVVKTYQIALGANPIGHKQRAGDQRTPEDFTQLITATRAASSTNQCISPIPTPLTVRAPNTAGKIQAAPL